MKLMRERESQVAPRSLSEPHCPLSPSCGLPLSLALCLAQSNPLTNECSKGRWRGAGVAEEEEEGERNEGGRKAGAGWGGGEGSEKQRLNCREATEGGAGVRRGGETDSEEADGEAEEWEIQ